MIYIYHHLGMGDHISCHGIVRHHCGIEDKVCLFVKPHNLNNVKRMFADLQNIEYIVGEDDFVNNYLSLNNITNCLKVGFTLNGHENFEKQFYDMAKLPVEFKHSKFYIQRNINYEKKIFDDLGLVKNEYVFVHDGGHKLRESFFESGQRIVRPVDHGLFDWMYVMENAKEIHCIDSSFICLSDCMETGNIPLFNHRYVRGYPENIKLYTNKNWNFIY